MKLAYAEMRVTLARLLFAFDISLASEKDRWDWGEQKTYIFWVSTWYPWSDFSNAFVGQTTITGNVEAKPCQLVKDFSDPHICCGRSSLTDRTSIPSSYE